MIKTTFIICFAKKILSVVTPVQEKDFILSGEETGNIFSIRVRQGDLFSTKYLFKASKKLSGRGKKSHLLLSVRTLLVFLTV